MISRWLVRNELSPKYSRFKSFRSASHEYRALHLGSPTCVEERGDGERGRDDVGHTAVSLSLSLVQRAAYGWFAQRKRAMEAKGPRGALGRGCPTCRMQRSGTGMEFTAARSVGSC